MVVSITSFSSRRLHDSLGRPVNARGIFCRNRADKLARNKQATVFLGWSVRTIN
jgi:hypothetical protein